MSDKNIAIAMTFIDGFNHHDFSPWSKLLSADYQGEYPGAPLLNREQAMLYNQVFLPAFPDIHFDVHRVITSGDLVIIHWTGRGTHTGPLATMSGQSIPATGKPGAVTGILISEIQNGKIVREQTYWDQMSLLTQLGLIPAA